MPINRTLSIQVTFACTHISANEYGGTASYVQTSSVPDLGDVVTSDGTINFNLTAGFDPTEYNESVDISFTLATPANVSPDGTTTPVVWASVHGAGMKVTAPGGGSNNEMVVQTVPGNRNLILIIDNDDDSNTYTYKPAVELPAVNNYYISLDPQIVNRPTNK